MSFDLNINNYNRDELIEMFELPQNFDKNIVEIKEAKLRDSIINNKEITKDTQSNTIKFLIKAKNIILNGSKPDQKLKDIAIAAYHSNFELQSSNLEEPAGEHMVQIRKNIPYISSLPSEFFPGVINPLKKKTIIKNLNIDTKFRENYYSSSSTNFHVVLPLNLNDVIQMQLSAIELPTTYYVVSKQYGNNFFNISVNGSSTVVNIPDGNYTQITIMNAINNQLALLMTPYNAVTFTINLTNATTGSGQTIVGFYDLSGNTSIELNFQADRFGNEDRGTPLPLKFGWALGFRNGIYTNNLNYVSEGVVDITGPKYVYLVVDDHNNNVSNNFFSAFNSSLLNKNILSRISLQANTFNVLEQNSLSLITTPRQYFGPVNLLNLDIQLLDEYGRIVDLNNMDFSFCLNLTTIYDL